MSSHLNKSVVALAVAVALAACGGGGKHPVAKPKVAAKTVAKPKPKAPVAPLSGVPDPTGDARRRCAVTVKIDNTQASHPKYGVDQADVVYEEVVEGGITRLAAIFNSHAPDRVGPVRSVRKTDQSIVWPIGGIFAYSGGAQYAIDSINTAPVKQIDETRAGAMMFRDPPDNSRYAPYNLWTHVDELFKAGGEPVPPPPLFEYRAPKAAVGGTPASSFVVGFQGSPSYATTWNWDATSATWLRSKLGGPDIDAEHVRLAPKNVVVMFVRYLGGNSQGLQAEAELTGSGNALVFTRGKEIKGTWSRPDKAKPAKLLNAQGAEIRLTPGQTWIELPDVSYAVTVTP